MKLNYFSTGAEQLRGRRGRAEAGAGRRAEDDGRVRQRKGTTMKQIIIKNQNLLLLRVVQKLIILHSPQQLK